MPAQRAPAQVEASCAKRPRFQETESTPPFSQSWPGVAGRLVGSAVMSAVNAATGSTIPDGNDGLPLVRSTAIAEYQVEPSGETLKWKSSSPVRPTSARPE